MPPVIRPWESETRDSYTPLNLKKPQQQRVPKSTLVDECFEVAYDSSSSRKSSILTKPIHQQKVPDTPDSLSDEEIGAYNGIGKCHNLNSTQKESDYNKKHTSEKIYKDKIYQKKIFNQSPLSNTLELEKDINSDECIVVKKNGKICFLSNF